MLECVQKNQKKALNSCNFQRFFRLSDSLACSVVNLTTKTPYYHKWIWRSSREICGETCGLGLTNRLELDAAIAETMATLKGISRKLCVVVYYLLIKRSRKGAILQIVVRFKTLSKFTFYSASSVRTLNRKSSGLKCANSFSIKALSLR